jgi:hypothetical protein
METNLETRWSNLNLSKKKFLDILTSWPSEKIQQQPAQGWSASQVIEHILTSETGTLGYMKKKSSSGWATLEIAGFEQEKNSQALNTRLASSERFRAPSVLPEPSNKFTLQQLETTWSALRNELEEFLSGIDPIHFDKLVFRQPAAGMLNITQTLEFLNNHIQHHIPQLNRIREELKF